jgi:hypothetical protein
MKRDSLVFAFGVGIGVIVGAWVSLWSYYMAGKPALLLLGWP